LRLGRGNPYFVGKEEVCIHIGVAEKVVNAPVQVVGSGLVDDVDDAARGVAELRGEVTGLYFEFLSGIYRGKRY